MGGKSRKGTRLSKRTLRRLKEALENQPKKKKDELKKED